MEGQLGVMIDVEEALYKLEEKNLYSAGLTFFSALGYPVEPLEIAINESMSRFVYAISKNHCIFSSDETHAMQSVASISWLFTLSNDIKVLRHVREARIDDIQISSINYFCVELDCNLYDRSMQAFVLTKVISKVVNTPVVVLFKHANHLLLSSIFMVHSENTYASKTYLSDWYLFDPVQDDVLMTLSNWHFGNYCDDNFYIFFMDWVHSMARPYFHNSESYEYVKFGRTSIVVRDHPRYDEMIIVDGVRYVCPDELAGKFVEQDPREFYGYDYVNDEETIEILIDDPEWILEELIDLDEFERMIGEADLSDDDEVGSDDDEDEVDPNNERPFLPSHCDINGTLIDISSIDDVVFEDPIKMLEYLESLDRRK